MSKPNGRISEEFVKKLSPPEAGQQIYWDDKVPGFGVRVSAGGSIAFVLNYSLNRKRRRFKIGRYPAWSATAARERAKELSVGVDKGDDPRELRRNSEAPTFRDLAKQYLEYAEAYKRPNSIRNDRSNIAKLLPEWGTTLLSGIKWRDIEAKHRSMRATPYQANRVLALISHMFTKAVEWDLCGESPIRRGAMKSVLYLEEPKQRWLKADEQKRLNEALDIYSDQRAASALRLLLLTGSREKEVLKADWSQFDLKRGVWTKPSHHTKQRKTEYVPLSDLALSLLRKLKPKKEGPLFPGASKKAARVTIRRPWMQALRAAGLVEAIERQGKRRKVIRYRPTVRLHDLRHTFASDRVNNGVSLHLVGGLIGHTNPTTTARYAHASQEALRAAANQHGGAR